MIMTKKTVLTSILKWHDTLSRLSYQLGALALGLIVTIYAYEVISRYLFDSPTRWASDFVSFLLLITVFLVLPWLTRAKGNVAVTVLSDQLSESHREYVIRAGYLVGAVACFCLGYIVFLETLRLYERGTGTLSTVSIPKWVLFVLIGYGLGNSGLYFLRLAAGVDTNNTGDNE